MLKGCVVTFAITVYVFMAMRNLSCSKTFEQMFNPTGICGVCRPGQDRGLMVVLLNLQEKEIQRVAVPFKGLPPWGMLGFFMGKALNLLFVVQYQFTV